MAQAKIRRQIRRSFEERGISVTAWATAQGFPVSVVYALLAGRTRGLRGNAHRAAVALGLKADPAISDRASSRPILVVPDEEDVP